MNAHVIRKLQVLRRQFLTAYHPASQSHQKQYATDIGIVFPNLALLPMYLIQKQAKNYIIIGAIAQLPSLHPKQGSRQVANLACKWMSSNS